MRTLEDKKQDPKPHHDQQPEMSLETINRVVKKAINKVDKIGRELKKIENGIKGAERSLKRMDKLEREMDRILKKYQRVPEEKKKKNCYKGKPKTK